MVRRGRQVARHGAPRRRQDSREELRGESRRVPGLPRLADDGKWVLPVGTVMVKSFLFDSKLLETRLLMRFDATTWVGYTYKWDEAQTDATLVGDESRPR